MFQWVGLFFRWGASVLSGGCAPWGVLVLMGEVFEKNSKMGEVPHHASPHYGKPWKALQAIINKLEVA